MQQVSLDFETRSLCDLKLSGAERYAEDLSTEIICLLWRLAGVWHEWWPGCLDDGLYAAADNEEIYFVAHNASFEQAIWRHKMVPVYGFPAIPVRRWRCTLASAAWRGLPLGLDKLGRTLQLPMNKDKEGNSLTLSLSKLPKLRKRNPLPANLPEITPQLRRRVMDYCKQDVVVEDGGQAKIGLLSPSEQRVWELDQTINQRGVRLDLDFVNAAQKVVDRTSAPLVEEFQGLTGLAKVGSPKLKDWCLANGLALENLQKKTILKLLDVEDEDDPDPAFGYESLAGDDDDSDGSLPVDRLPWNVRRVLEIKAMLAGAAIKKLSRMQHCINYDGRARQLLQFHAAHSGRWGGRLIQPQNFPRDIIKGIDPEHAVEAIMSGDPLVVERELGLPALDAVARSLRHALMADPGKTFVVGDFSQIEARIVLAMAGQHDKTSMMAGGYPVYFDMAEQIYNQPKGSWAVTDKELLAKLKHDFIQEYTIGKNTILGCGFQMGGGKFHARYCPEQPQEFADGVVQTYREDWAPKVPELWKGLEYASLRAVERRTEQEAYGVRFYHNGPFLCARLPAPGRVLSYFMPSMAMSKFDRPCWKYQRGFGRADVQMYGGLETENVVQALARALLCSAMFRVEAAGMPIVLTCHDEIVVEVDEDQADEVWLKELMIEPTDWSAKMQVPLDAEVWTGNRYRK